MASIIQCTLLQLDVNVRWQYVLAWLGVFAQMEIQSELSIQIKEPLLCVFIAFGSLHSNWLQRGGATKFKFHQQFNVNKINFNGYCVNDDTINFVSLPKLSPKFSVPLNFPSFVTFFFCDIEWSKQREWGTLYLFSDFLMGNILC